MQLLTKEKMRQNKKNKKHMKQVYSLLCDLLKFEDLKLFKRHSY